MVLALCSGLLSTTATVAFSQNESQFESFLASAQQAQSNGDFAAAADSYRRAIGIHPEMAELRANLGLMYYQIGRDEQAIEVFRQALRLNPGLFVPNLFLGLEYVKLKRFNEAASLLKRAALSKPTDVQVQLGLGQAYAALGKTQLAIAAYLRAIDLQPRNADIWYHLGVIYLEQVEADARILLARHKQSGFLQTLVADSFAEQHQYIQAAEAYKTALTFHSFPPDTHARYGFVLVNQHDFDGAEREVGNELRSNPGSLTAKLVSARLHLEQGAIAEGTAEIEDVWKTDTGFVRSNAYLLTTGLPDSKRLEIQKAFADQPLSGDSREELLALLRGGTGSEESADSSEHSTKRVADTHLQDNSSGHGAAQFFGHGEYSRCSDLLKARSHFLQAKGLELLAVCSYFTGNYKTAADAAQMLTSSTATQAQGLYWEIRSTQKLAAAALTRASQIDSNSPKLHVLLGDVYRQRMWFPNAEREYHKALALRPDDVGARFGLSLALLGDSNIDASFQLATALSHDYPDDPELNALMGEILCARRDFSGAEPYLKKGLNAKPELVPHVHALLGKVYAKTGRTEQAIKELKLGLADDKDGSVHYQIAALYLKVGDRRSAKLAFETSNRMHREGLTRAAVAMQQGEGYSDFQ